MPEFKKFEQRPPSHQNAVDIFGGHWDADLSFAAPGLKAGTSALFTGDFRPAAAAKALGQGGRLDGMNILELGPLEGAHTYALEGLGAASIVSIEANIEAFLKCLIVKEVCGLTKTRFMLGDFAEYLKDTQDRFDLIFCSGVLYHMTDPVTLIQSISRVTDRCFVWTHYYDASHYPGPARTAVQHPAGFTLFQLQYPDMDYAKFWGGNRPIASWLSKGDILRAFSEAGLSEIQIIDDAPSHPNGASFTFGARRPGAGYNSVTGGAEFKSTEEHRGKNLRHDARYHKYRNLLLRYVDPAKMKGLEIGAFDLPLIRPEEGQVEFLDRATTEELREKARLASGHSSEFVVPVDYVVNEKGWEAVPAGYDWMAAAHVIQYVPDMVNWLNDIATKLNVLGVLFLVIPDKRFTFDLFRSSTSLGQIIQSYLTNQKHPPMGSVFDAVYYSKTVGRAAGKQHDLSIDDFGRPPFEPALTAAKKAEAEHVEVHCNIFTDRSFKQIMTALCDAGIVPFRLEEAGSASEFETDFHCVLRRISRPSAMPELDRETAGIAPTSPDDRKLFEMSQTRWRGDEQEELLTWGRRMNANSLWDIYQRRREFLSSDKILEIGPGYGRILRTAIDRMVAFSLYIGIDLSAARVERLNSRFGRPDVRFEVGDVDDWNGHLLFDVVLCSATFEHLYPDCKKALANLRGQMLKSAHLFIDFVHATQQHMHFEPGAFIRLYSEHELREIFTACGYQVHGVERCTLGLDAHERPIERHLVIAKPM